MKKPRKKIQPNGNRRRELLHVCARLFREKGFDGTTIRDISSAAGMHSGSPFYHFASKQEMLLAVMEEGLAEGLRRSEAVLAGRLPPARKFRRLVRSHLGTILEKGNDFIPVLLYDWRSLTPANRRRVIALKDRYDALWQRMLDELARAGLIAGGRTARAPVRARRGELVGAVVPARRAHDAGPDFGAGRKTASAIIRA